MISFEKNKTNNSNQIMYSPNYNDLKYKLDKINQSLNIVSSNTSLSNIMYNYTKLDNRMLTIEKAILDNPGRSL
jgi:hypothetical protein